MVDAIDMGKRSRVIFILGLLSLWENINDSIHYMHQACAVKETLSEKAGIPRIDISHISMINWTTLIFQGKEAHFMIFKISVRIMRIRINAVAGVDLPSRSAPAGC
jgi:hypothetical protein